MKWLFKTCRGILVAIMLVVASCTPKNVFVSDELPEIYPDYIGVTVPSSMQSLPFQMVDGRKFKADEKRVGDTLWISVTAWNKGSKVATQYAPFFIAFSHDPIDPYISYRLIEPGYENWHDMGIYQRELASFDESPVVTNQVNNRGCVNCHNYDSGNPDRFLFHARGAGGGTVFVDGDSVKLVNLTKVGAMMQGVYPAWHPDGRYVVFSSNKTFQSFSVAGTQPIEVFDAYSDLIVMDLESGETSLVPGAADAHRLETFPGWSPEGDKLYYCSAAGDTVNCEERASIHYKLMSLNFKDGEFVGEPCEVLGGDDFSVSFPRVYGDKLIYTKSAYGTFPIWHREADLWMLDLTTGGNHPLTELNSEDTESYHSWSSEGKWIVFSSRRDDGRYTRLYLAHYKGDGHFDKPFMLPQRKPEYNQYRYQSYNIPEFMRGKVADRSAKYKKLFEQ